MKMEAIIGETSDYERKEMLERSKPKSWLKSVSAFANGNGGVIVFGISDSDEVVGLADPQGDADAISEAVKAKLDPVPSVFAQVRGYGFHQAKIHTLQAASAVF